MNKKSNAKTKPKSQSPVSFFVVERGKEKVLKTRGFRQLGKLEMVLPTGDVNAGVKVLSTISAKVLNNEILMQENTPITGIVAVTLFMKSGIFDGEQVMILTTRA